MFNITKKEMSWGGVPLILETGKVARQADAAVMVTYGKTVVLCTVTAAKEANNEIDFLPLTVVYQEKTYAAGRFPGGFFKREAKPSEKEVLTSRLIDRAIRPLFASNFHYEVQVICTVLSHDLINSADVAAFIGASAAIALTDMPFTGPVAASRVGYIDNKLVLNTVIADQEKSQLDLVIAGTKDSVLMVESQVDSLDEETMLEALKFGHKEFVPVIDFIADFAKEGKTKSGKEPVTYNLPVENHQLLAQIKDGAWHEISAAYKINSKQQRYSALSEIKARLVAELANEEVSEFEVKKHVKLVEKEVLRQEVLKTKLRLDGRKLEQIRPIDVEVGFLPQTHGSALFTRGETQAIVAATLGTSMDEQIMDLLENNEAREHFLLHYNFPPYSVGEVSQLRPPGRREIGHGKLAWRALRTVLPDREAFPYSIRVVSEITESNGSSSMASVCGGSLAMMDAGIPLRAPVAGIAMGLILEGKDYVVLSDILGDEDHLGDMDFKVAGTAEAVTALQMDIKVTGITFEIMEKALEQAKHGRIHILGEMNKVLATPRSNLNPLAPVVKFIQIKKDKIREVIGSGGKVVKEICELSKAKIDISEDGGIKIFASSQANLEIAVNMIQNIVAEVEVGEIYEATVVKITEYGAFADFIGGNSGLIHVSEIANERVAKVEDHLSEGQKVKVKLIDIDNRGKMKLSMKNIPQE